MIIIVCDAIWFIHIYFEEYDFTNEEVRLEQHAMY